MFKWHIFALLCCVGLTSIQWHVAMAGEIYIHPSWPQGLVTDCTSATECTSENPCGPGPLDMLVLDITVPCTIIAKVSVWTKPVLIRSTTAAVDQITFRSDVPKHTEFNLSIECHLNPSCGVVVQSFAADATIISVDTSGPISVRNSMLRLASYINYPPATFRCSGTLGGALELSNTQVLHFPGFSVPALLLQSIHSLHIGGGSDISITLLGRFTDSAVNQVVVRDSMILSQFLFPQVSQSLLIQNSTIIQMTDGFLNGPSTLPNTIAILGSTFRSGQPGVTGCIINPAAPSPALTIPYLTINDSSFTDFELTKSFINIQESFILDGNTLIDSPILTGFVVPSGVVASILNNQFSSSSLSMPLLALYPSSGSRIIELNNNSFPLTLPIGIPPPLPCGLFLGNSQVDIGSEGISLGVLCGDPGAVISISGPMKLTIEFSPNSGQLIATPESEWFISSGTNISSEVSAASGHIIFELLDYQEPIHSNLGFLSLPALLSVNWLDLMHPPRVGSTYTVIDGLVGVSATLPSPVPSLDFNFTLELSEPFLNMTVTEVKCPLGCDSQGSVSTCLVFGECNCRSGWSGARCGDAPPGQPTNNPPPLSCPQPSPGATFTCVSGQWVSHEPIEEETFVVPGGLGPIVVEGDVNITESITFQGLGSELLVNGCIALLGDITIVLTPEEIELIKQDPTVQRQLIASLSPSCLNGTDLSSVPLSVSSSTCDKVSATNAGSRSSLTVLFNVDSSGCKKKSKLVAIIVPSVLGAILLIVVISLLVGLKLRADRMKIKR